MYIKSGECIHLYLRNIDSLRDKIYSGSCKVNDKILNKYLKIASVIRKSKSNL